jgi:hypothetical protein
MPPFDDGEYSGEVSVADGGAARGVFLVLAALILALCVGLGVYLGKPRLGGAGGDAIPEFTIPVGKVREPLPYRIVSFHRGRADKGLIKLAHQLGFNGVQFQIEGSNEGGIADFAARDAREGLIDYCHSLGMQVTVWVRELADLPGPWMPEYLGEPAVGNNRLWAALDNRYEWILSKAIPKADGLVLTVVETQVRATSTPIMRRIVDIVSRQCERHKKQLIVRTFVWHPEELSDVMRAVRELPSDMTIMSKVVPQDWQMRGDNAAEIGAVGGRPQIIEYDVAGEYFLQGAVANCFPDLLKRQFEYGLSKGVKGICVRVDRDDFNVLHQPQEVNLWALGMLAAGASDSMDEVWQRWARYRYGEAAAGGVIKALRPTGDVVAELLSIGPFTHGDTRSFPPMPDDYVFDKNWQNWRWNDAYLRPYQLGEAGDANFIAEVTAQKVAGIELAKRCLADLEAARGTLDPVEYDILHTKLQSNLFQLRFRMPMVMAALHFRAWKNARNDEYARQWLAAYRRNLAEVKELADELTRMYPIGGGAGARVVSYRGRTWTLDVPLGVSREALYRWAYDAERMLNYYW